MIPAENLRDWRGKKVIDDEGHKIGELEAVYVDTATDEPAFLTVRTGGLTARQRLVFVPAAGSTVSPKAVRVHYPRKQVREAPSIELDGELSAVDEPAVFAYYQLDYAHGVGGERRLARR